MGNVEMHSKINLIFFILSTITSARTEKDCQKENENILQENARLRSDASNAFARCKTNATRIFLKEVCPDVRDIFAPFNLTHNVQFTEALRQNYCDVPKFSSLTEFETLTEVQIDRSLPTVMLVGATGAGKSYLANALFGEIKPSQGPFETGGG